MAGQYRFKDINGNIVAQISASAQGAISFSGSAVDFSNASTITLGQVQLAGTASNALLLDGFDSTAFLFTSSFNTISQSVSSQLTTLQTTSGSNIGRLNNLESKSASVDISISNINNVTSSFSPRVSNLESKSASVDISISNINSFTASNGNTSLNSKTGSYATTGSNTFFGTQTYSGSVYIANDLIVQGSSSIQYISASSVSIGTNIVRLNTANPTIRYAGLTMIDSGSVGGSGSFLYDSVEDEFIFVHRGNGTNVTSSHFVLGPETYDNLGNETYLTCNRLSKGTGKEHLVDSTIFDNGTTVCVNGNLIGTGTACFGSVTSGGNICTSYVSLSNSYPNITFLQNSIGNIVTTGANDIAFRPNDAEKMRITSTGNVGIGATSPNAPLHICNTCTITNVSIENVNCAGYALYQAKSACTAYTWQMGSWNDGTYRIGQSGVGDYMTITTCGKVGILATDPKWLLEICCNSSAGGAGGYPAVTINNPNVAGYSAYYFYKGASQMGGMEISNSTCNILINSLSTINFQVNNTNKLTITNDTACFSSSPSNIMGLGTKVHEGTYNVYTGPSCVLTLPINYGTASSIYLFGTLLGNDSMHYAHMMYYYRNDFAGFVGSTITQMSCHNVSTAGQRYTFSVVDPGGLGKSGCPLQINITCANGPSVGAGSYYTRFKIVVYNI